MRDGRPIEAGGVITRHLDGMGVAEEDVRCSAPYAVYSQLDWIGETAVAILGFCFPGSHQIILAYLSPGLRARIYARMDGVRVTLFTTCLVQGLYPQVIVATRSVLARAGCEVVIPRGQTCCGQAPFNAGLVDDTLRLARKVIDDLHGTDPIVVPSGSCADMLTHHLPHRFEGDPDLHARAQAVSKRVRELSAFLVDDLGVTDVGARFDHVVAFHNSCHGMRNLGLGRQARELLAKVEGLRLVELSRPEECCGFGGLFSVELPEVSAAIMSSKIADLEETEARYLVGTDASCLFHLAGGLHRRKSPVEVKHLAEVLASQ